VIGYSVSRQTRQDGISTVAWQLQEAKQRFSEVVRRAIEEGPQTVTLVGEKPGLKELLFAGPDWSVLDLERDRRPARDVEL
jgi:hypothetical protein